VSTPAPELAKGTLLLVGGGPSQSDLDAEFLQLAGGSAARIVVIPTASFMPGDSASMRDPSRWGRGYGAHVAVLHAFSRREADSEEFVKPLRDATGVWMTGGEAELLIVSYLGTRTERELKALLARGGVIGGTSAGALVWGSESQIFRAPKGGNSYKVPSADELLVGDPRAVSFGTLRNVLIAPHFTEYHMAAAVEKTVMARPGLLAFGIDEATALEVHGDQCRVLGRGRVTVFDGKDHAGRIFTLLGDGGRYDLRKRVTL